MDPIPALHDLATLSDLSGVTPRTIRYYIEQGLLPAVGAGREARKYGDGHLNRLRLIRQWQKQHVSLDAIRERIKDLSDEAVAHLLAAERPTTPSATGALDYINQVLGGRPTFSEPSPRYASHRPATASAAAARSSLPNTTAVSAAPATPVDADTAAIDAMFNTFPGADATGPAAAYAQPPIPTPTSTPAPAPTDAWPRERAQWERLSLHDDVELHVRRPLSRDMNRRLERLLEVARRILHDD